jgi:hypothetical protein
MIPTFERTPGDTLRRRALHNAAAGHTRVVLYVCTTDKRATPLDIVAALRLYSEARDWEVAEVVLDAEPLSTPLDRREQWAAVRQRVTEQLAEGVVTLQGHACDTDESARAAQALWLGERGAFLSIVPTGRPAQEPERTTT